MKLNQREEVNSGHTMPTQRFYKSLHLEAALIITGPRILCLEQATSSGATTCS